MTRAALKSLVETMADRRATPPVLQPAELYFDLAGETIGARLLLTTGADGTEYALRPEFTLAVAADYLASPEAGRAETIGYLGPVFRQRATGPAEFEQAGLEFFGHDESEDAFAKALHFAFETAGIYGLTGLRLRLGAVDLFEALLVSLQMPAIWRPRIRARLGYPDAMARLLGRLARPPRAESAARYPAQRDKLVDAVAEEMLAAGLNPLSGRQATEIADRYMEKMALAAAPVPPETVAVLSDYLAVAGPADEALARLETLAARAGADLADPLGRLKSRIETVSGSATEKLLFDAGFSPPFDYYTGQVFELATPQGAVVASGGRYDRLLERLGAAEPIPAVGCALWLDRLQAAAS